MKRHDTHLTGSGIITKAVATATILGCSIVPQTASASPRPEVVTSGIYVSMLNPTSVASDGSKELEISAFYQAATSTGGVTTFELFVDGQREASQSLDVPDMRGVVSFRIAPGTLTPGQHHFVITVSAADQEVSSAKSDLTIDQPIQTSAVSGTDGATANTAPAVAIMSPAPQATVQGIIDIKVDAHDNSGKAPYVSLFIDNTFKTLRNYPPFDFAWDTTRVQNGLHTIEVWGYNDDQAVGHAEPLTVYVDNPSGRTTVRHDLLDSVPDKVLLHATEAATPKFTALHRNSAPNKLYSRFLAQNGTPLAIDKVDLASAQSAGDLGQNLSEQTLLMAPFLVTKDDSAPTVSRPVIVKNRPMLASAGSADFNSVANYLTTTLSSGSDTFSDDTELIEPTVEEKVMISEVAHKSSEITKPVFVATTGLATPTRLSSPITLAQSHVEIANIDSADIALENPDVTLLSPAEAKVATPSAKVNLRAELAKSQINTDQFTIATTALSTTESGTAQFDAPSPSIEAPAVSMKAIELAVHRSARQLISVSHRALLATSQIRSIANTEMASATVDSSELFAPSSSLQSPVVKLKSFVPANQFGVSVPSAEVLGQSGTGFPTSRVLRSTGAYQLVMNDHIVKLQQPLQDHNSLLYAPFRQIFESEGGVLSWNGRTHQVHALSGSRDIMLTIGSKKATVNQQPVTLSASPYINVGHTMIPLTFVPAALNATVTFDPSTGHLVINSND